MAHHRPHVKPTIRRHLINLRSRAVCVYATALLGSVACKGSESSFAPPSVSYTLTVATAPGVSGTPAAGTFASKDGDTLSYSFTAATGYENLSVMLDSTFVPASGFVVMRSDHRLVAAADTKVTLLPQTQTLVAQARGLLTNPDPIAAAETLLSRYDTLLQQLGVVEGTRQLQALNHLAYDATADSLAIRELIQRLGGQTFTSAAALNRVPGDAPHTSVAVVGGRSTILIYVNGIFNAPDDPWIAQVHLTRLAAQAGFDFTNPSNPDQILSFYNASWTYNKDYSKVSCALSIASLLDAESLLSLLKVLNTCTALHDLTTTTQQLGNVLGVIPAGDPTAQQLSTLVQSQIARGRNVVLVGHSQGSLILQEALHQLYSTSPNLGTCIGALSLAAPTSLNWPVGGETVAGVIVKGKRAVDLVGLLGLNAFPTLATNISDAFDSRLTELGPLSVLATPVADVFMHFMVDSYLQGDKTSQWIVDNLKSERDHLQQSCQPPPTVETRGVTVPSTTATVFADVNPSGLATDAWFEWGLSNDPATFSSTTHQAVGSGTSIIPISADLAGLSPTTTYYYRAAALNSRGTAKGDILSFRTPPPSMSGTYTGTFTQTVAGNPTAGGQLTFVLMRSAASVTGIWLAGGGASSTSTAGTGSVSGTISGSNLALTLIVPNGSCQTNLSGSATVVNNGAGLTGTISGTDCSSTASISVAFTMNQATATYTGTFAQTVGGTPTPDGQLTFVLVQAGASWSGIWLAGGGANSTSTAGTGSVSATISGSNLALTLIVPNGSCQTNLSGSATVVNNGAGLTGTISGTDCSSTSPISVTFGVNQTSGLGPATAIAMFSGVAAHQVTASGPIRNAVGRQLTTSQCSHVQETVGFSTLGLLVVSGPVGLLPNQSRAAALMPRCLPIGSIVNVPR
jgi:hypothetical protein